MKKSIITLAVLVMAFGNVSFAQSKAELKSIATQNVLKHFGVRDESMLVPESAEWSTTIGDKYRTTYTYDEYENYRIEEFTEINEGDGWTDFSLVTYEYGFYGNVLESVVMVASDNGWQNESRASYSYDGNMLKEVIVQEWEDGDWENEEKQVYDYSGLVITVLYWDWNGSNWASNELYTYTYSDGGMELLKQYMQGGAWQNDEKDLYTFDFTGRVVEIVEQDWNNSSWVNDERTTYVYEGDVYTAKTIEGWDGSYWINQYRFEYEYDGNGNATHGESFWFAGVNYYPVDGDIEMPYAYSEMQDVYYGGIVDVKYIDLTGVEENTPAVSFNVYPVPAENEIQIQAEGFQKAEIFTLTGQMLLESVRNTIDVSGLATGIYMLKVYDQTGNSAMQKFVVK